MPPDENRSSPTMPAKPTMPVIVGGQPSGKRDDVVCLSRGVERIVLLAAKDDGFRKEFASDRSTALKKAGIVLAEPENLLLGNISTEEILSMARCVSPRTESRKRRFLRAAATLAALTGLHACGDEGRDAPRGIRPDEVVQGIRPDVVEEFASPESSAEVPGWGESGQGGTTETGVGTGEASQRE